MPEIMETDPIRNGYKLTDHFWLYQFECPCCKAVRIHSGLVEVLELIWQAKGEFSISEGYRCEDYHHQIYSEINKERLKKDLPVRRVPVRSRHLIGQAVDISMPLSKSDEQWLFNIGVRGFGRARAWSHIDIRLPDDFDNGSVSFASQLTTWTY